MLAEARGRWPASVGCIIIILLPKPDGGRRPIGLFPTIIRVWMKARLEIAQAWLIINDRSYFYAGPAKGADVAAWKQALVAETSHSAKMDYACVLLDLVKAFDSIPFDWLVIQAKKYLYNQKFSLLCNICNVLRDEICDLSCWFT